MTHIFVEFFFLKSKNNLVYVSNQFLLAIYELKY